MAFLHGVEVIQLPGGIRPLRVARTSVIGLVGTAPDADAEKYPLNQPVLIAGSRLDAGMLGQTGTLPPSIDGIFDQSGAVTAVVRVAANDDPEQQKANIIGGTDVSGTNYQGVWALLGAKARLGFAPKILVAPGYTHNVSVVSEMIPIANALRATIVADGKNTNDADAIAYRNNFGSSRVYLVDPGVRRFDPVTAQQVVEPASARVAGMIARSDNERGVWYSPSNAVMFGIDGPARDIDFELGDPNSRANLLNEKEVATIIVEKGPRLWGDRSCSDDPRFAFLCIQRMADLLHDTLVASHMYAVDQPITRAFFDNIAESVSGFMASLQLLGAIAGGQCIPSPGLNSKFNIKQGKAFFDFDYSGIYPAEHIVFRSSITGKYLVEIVA